MSKILHRIRDNPMKGISDYHMYESRINKTLYYVNYPNLDCLSLPLTELAAEIFSENQRGQSLDRLHYSDAVDLSWHACVSPIAFVMAVVYLERLKKINPEYLRKVASSDLFLVSLVVSYKFLCDDGHPDEVFMDEWASSARISLDELKQLERDFLKAIDWQVFVNDSLFWKKLSQIETALARKQGIFRGYFTYTELEKLLKLSNLPKQLHIYCLILFLTMVTLYISTLLLMLSSVIVSNQISIHSNKTDSIKHSNTIDLIQINSTQLCKSLDDGVRVEWWSVSMLNWLTEISQLSKFDFSTTDFDYFANQRCTSEIILDQILEIGAVQMHEIMKKSWHPQWPDDIEESMK